MIQSWTKLGKKIESTCRKALYEFSLIEDKKIAIALSGGKDSLTLLLMLKAISGRGFPPFELTAIHVKGAFSCGPSISGGYLSSFLEELEVPLIECESDQKLETLECYSCSRARRESIFSAAKERGISTIAFGHHRDDNVQTMLMNLLHKGEFAGMLPKVPMVNYGVTIVRPLIYVTEHEIREFAKLQGFARITCQCPVGQKSKRTEVESLLSELEEKFPNARNNIATAVMQSGLTKALRP